ncbi:hypothetical protein EVAR_51987_1 [Eumeta japonica]|uniref:Uncharacterized protein n=1 Tax=Eumeta variegata TaxID=151549 RepID=A0A4C1Y4R8_EUMVA|nr:hypothetical protein EVAR_51987_1 [Eumeta japonica]
MVEEVHVNFYDMVRVYIRNQEVVVWRRGIPEIVTTTYIAVIEAIVLYALYAWVLATRKLRVPKKLNTAQRSAALKAYQAHGMGFLQSRSLKSRKTRLSSMAQMA